MKSRTAEKTIESLMTRFNKNPQSLVFSRLADEYRKDGNYSKAIEICVNGLQNYPDYVTGRLVLGLCYVEQGNHQAAIQELLAILSHDRKNQNAIKMIADLYSRQGNSNIAGELYNLLFKSDPGNRNLQIISRQYQYSGNTDIFSILGLPSPQTSFNFKAKDTLPQQDLNKTVVESQLQESSMLDAQTMSITDSFELPLSMDDSASTPPVTSEEIGNRMDELFSEMPSDLSESPVENLTAAPEDIVVDEQQSFSENQVSGEDITDRMNALFGEESDNVPHETSNYSGIQSLENNENNITGNDIASQINNLEGNFGVEELDIQPGESGTPFNIEENASSSFELESPDSSLNGSEVSDQIESLFGDDKIVEQPDFDASLSLEVPEELTNDLLSGDNFNTQLDQIVIDESENLTSQPQADIDLDSIETNFTPSETAITQSDDTLSGDDFAAHIDAITSEHDPFLIQNDSTDTLQNDLLSPSQAAEPKPESESISGDDFSSHLDSLITPDESGPDMISDITDEIDAEKLFAFDETNEPESLLPDLEPNLPENQKELVSENLFDFEAPSESPESINLIDNLISEDISGNLLDNDDNVAGEVQKDFITGEETRNANDENLTGDDFTNHLDMILGNNQKQDESSLYDKISQSYERIPQETEQPQKNTADNENIVSGDDISLQIDMLDRGDIPSIDTDKLKTSSEPGLPFSNTEFEETMQIDHSFIENIQSDILNEKTINENDKPEHMLDTFETPSPETPFNPFEFENETIQIDRKDLGISPDDISTDDTSENITDDFEINTSDESMVLEIQSGPSDNEFPQQSDTDAEVLNNQDISEMDVMVTPSRGIQEVTGEDVVDKLDILFPSENTANETENSPDTIFLNDQKSEEQPTEPEPISNNNTARIIDEVFNEDVLPSENPDAITGNDVENRINEFFNENDTRSQSENYQEAAEALEIEDIDKQDNESFFITELENDFDTDELQKQSSQKEQSVPSSGSSSELPVGEIDERDRPYSIPDHVLTPTLADIYYQQGQMQLAMQIYARLLDKDPNNLKLQERIDEIQAQITAQENDASSVNESKNDSLRNLSPEKTVRPRKKTTGSDKPLSGVRIKKGKKGSKK